MRLALVQSNPVVGDITGNAAMLGETYRRAVADGADLVVSTELAITGYPPEDLVLKPAFVRASQEAVTRLAGDVGPVPLVVGFVEPLDAPSAGDWPAPDAREPSRPQLANAAAVLVDGAVAEVYRKQRLPNYGVFDEARYFRPGSEPVVVDVAGARVGVTICEDLWGDGGPVEAAAAAGADVVLSLNASPYDRCKRPDRERWACHHAVARQVVVAYVNQVGGQDEVVFDGASFVVAADGHVAARGARFASDVLVVDVDPEGGVRAVSPQPDPGDQDSEVYAALVLAIRDYVDKNGFASVVLGISGGIDSALVAALAVDALGPHRVTGVALPSSHSSPGSLTDARLLADNLGLTYLELPIAEVMAAFEATLASPFDGTEPGLAEENLQARIRGSLLMALSNKFGHLVLVTGNKSESAVGYSTLYGDMAGGFAPIKDVEKTLVWQLARHRNAVAGTDVIPESTITKPPSAELRPEQEDTDSLPPYDVLDPIIAAYIEQDRSVEGIVALGYDPETVTRVVALIDRAEHKRRQSPPGVKITSRAFGRDRRLPITQRWTG